MLRSLRISLLGFGTKNLRNSESELKAFGSVAVESPMDFSLFNITVNSKNDVSFDQPYPNGFYPNEYIGCIKVTNDDKGKFHY